MKTILQIRKLNGEKKVINVFHQIQDQDKETVEDYRRQKAKELNCKEQEINLTITEGTIRNLIKPKQGK